MGPPFSALSARLRAADSVPAIVASVIDSLLELASMRGIAITAHGTQVDPTVWVGSAYFDPDGARAYLEGGHREDPCLARVRETHAPVMLQRLVGPSESRALGIAWGHADPTCALWVGPILACGELLGTIRFAIADRDEDCARTTALAMVGTLVSIRLAQLGIDEALDDSWSPPLTSRQREIVRLVARGCTNGEIGRMLAISANAVKKQLSHVLDVLQMSNRTELASIAGRWSGQDVPAPTGSGSIVHTVSLRVFAEGSRAVPGLP